MTSKLDLLTYGHNIARLITKHGGWLDDNDPEIIRFPTPHALAQFNKELDKRYRDGR